MTTATSPDVPPPPPDRMAGTGPVPRNVVRDGAAVHAALPSGITPVAAQAVTNGAFAGRRREPPGSWRVLHAGIDLARPASAGSGG